MEACGLLSRCLDMIQFAFYHIPDRAKNQREKANYGRGREHYAAG